MKIQRFISKSVRGALLVLAALMALAPLPHAHPVASLQGGDIVDDHEHLGGSLPQSWTPAGEGIRDSGPHHEPFNEDSGAHFHHFGKALRVSRADDAGGHGCVPLAVPADIVALQGPGRFAAAEAERPLRPRFPGRRVGSGRSPPV